MSFEPAPIAIHNERQKARASYLNAFSIGLVGFAVLRPLTDATPSVTVATASWFVAALALRVIAHDVPGGMRREVRP